MDRIKNSLEDRIEQNMGALYSVVQPIQLFKDLRQHLHDLDRKKLRKQLKRDEEVDEMMVYDIIDILQKKSNWPQLLLIAFRKGNQTEALELIGERTDKNLDSPRHVREPSPGAHTRPTNLALNQLNGNHGFGEPRTPDWSGCESPDPLMQTVKDKGRYPEQSAEWHNLRRYQPRFAATLDPQLCQGQPVPVPSDNQHSLEDNTKQEGGNWNELSGKTPDCPSRDMFTDTSPGDTQEDSAPGPTNSEQRDTERPEYSRRPPPLEYESLFQGNRITVVNNGPLIVNVNKVRGNFEIANQTSQSSNSTSDSDSAPHDESFQSIDVQSTQQTPTEVSHETSQKMPIETTTEMSPLEEQRFDCLTQRSESFELGDRSSVREAIANRSASSPSGTSPYSRQPGTHTHLMLLKTFDEANISERTCPATKSPSESDLPSSSIVVLRGANTSSYVAESSQSCVISQPGLAADNQHVDTNSIQRPGSPSAHSNDLQQVPVTEVRDLESFTESTSMLPVSVQEDDSRSSSPIHPLQPGCEDVNVHLLNAEVEAEEPRPERVRPSSGSRWYVADKDNLEPETFQSKCESNRECSDSSVFNRGQENQLPEAEQNKQYNELSENYLSTGLPNATVSVETASPVKGLETSVQTSKSNGPIKNSKKSKRRKKSRK